MRHIRTTLLAATAVAAVAAAGASAGTVAQPTARTEISSVSTATQRAGLPERQVVVISLDGLNPTAITELGREGTPTLHRLMRQGASTLNARASVEQTETLPNHTGMVTGRRIDKAQEGHGVTWNDERVDPPTVQDAAGHGVDSIFSMAYRQGLSSALYSAKEKLSLFQRSWPNGTDKVLIDENNRALTTQAVSDLKNESFDFTLLHISLPDRAGHASGWLSEQYLTAVRRSDELVGDVVSTIRSDDRLAERVTVIVAADHGGPRGVRRHSQAELLGNYRVPFLMWGRGVARGADLYDLSPKLADPGRALVGYDAARQPVRNAYVANAAAEILGIPAVRGSQLGADSQLNWR